jgi:thioredoxin reductase (NADPH)
MDGLERLSTCALWTDGDVRSGSVKRVGGAIGEGAAAVALIHQYLAAAGAVSMNGARGRAL